MSLTRVVKTLIIFLSFLSITLCYGEEKYLSPAGDEIPYCVSFPQSALTNVNTIYIPFTLVGRLIIVEARVDTLEGHFILDTGAERLVLNQKYFTAETRDMAVAATGNTGLVTSVSQKLVDTLHLDQLSVKNLRAHIVDLGHIELKKSTRILGILGYNVFENFELFIDFQNSRIVLSRVDRNGIRLDSIKAWEEPYDSLRFDLINHVIIVESAVDNVKMRFMLDSGAELNLIDRRVNRKVLDRFTVIKRVNLIGAAKKEVEVLAGTLSNVRCGNQTCDSMNTLLTSMNDINSAFGVNLNGVLGYEFLSKRRVMINYKKRKLYFFSPLRS